MKKIFAKELAALAVLALAFTGCNTAFDGTNANFSEKEAEYTDRSGAIQSVNNAGNVTVTVATAPAKNIYKNNKKNEVAVTISSFSKINLSSADEAIHFQQLTNNTANAAYYPIRGADLPKNRIKVTESSNTTVITYEVDGTGVTANTVAVFIDATKLKTRGGTPVLAGDGNLKRGEVSDSLVRYISADGDTDITYTYAENFAPTYEPFGAVSTTTLSSSGKLTGVRRVEIAAVNKAKPGAAAEYESGIADKLNFVLQYREPTSTSYKEEKLTFVYHDAAQTTVGDTWSANSYTADIKALPIGTYWRVVGTVPEGITAPAWYKEVYNHEAVIRYTVVSTSTTTYREGAKISALSGVYTLHASVPSYIADSTGILSGSDLTSSYNPTNISKATIESAQRAFFTLGGVDNYITVTPNTTVGKLSPTAAKDFIVVDGNNKKIAADVDVVLKSYNDSTTTNGDVDYVKITVKDVRYRNTAYSEVSSNNLHVAVGKGTKIVENKSYPGSVAFGYWDDVTDDDAKGYILLN